MTTDAEHDDVIENMADEFFAWNMRTAGYGSFKAWAVIALDIAGIPNTPDRVRMVEKAMDNVCDMDTSYHQYAEAACAACQELVR